MSKIDFTKVFNDYRTALEEGYGIRIKNMNTEHPEIELIPPEGELKSLSEDKKLKFVLKE